MAIAAHLEANLRYVFILKKSLKIFYSFYYLKNFKKDNNILLVRNLFINYFSYISGINYLYLKI